MSGSATFGGVLSGHSGQEETAWNQLGYETSIMNTWMVHQYSEMQNLLNKTIIPQLTQMATNPQGFGAQALSAMRSTLINQVGTQAASQTRQMQQNFASQNLAGLGSGVQQALAANIGQSAAGQEASGLNSIAIANANAQMQQQQYALSGLQGAVGQLGQLPQSAGLASQLANAEFSGAYNLSNQTGMGQQLVSGLVGTGLNALGAMAGMPEPIGGMLGSLGSNIAGGGGGGGGILAMPSIGITGG